MTSRWSAVCVISLIRCDESNTVFPSPARALHLSESTVKAHFGRILMKLALPHRVQAVILAYELGIVRPTGR